MLYKQKKDQADILTVTGNDDIQIDHDNVHVDNDLIDDANDDGNDQDTTGTA